MSSLKFVRILNTFLALLLVFFIVGLPETQAKEGNIVDNIGLEKQMREIGARWRYINIAVGADADAKKKWYHWPECIDCSGGKGKHPTMPKKELYGKKLTKSRQRDLVKAIVDCFYITVAKTDGTVEWVDKSKIDPSTTWDPTNCQFDVATKFPKNWGATITKENYPTVFTTISGYIAELEVIRLRNSATRVTTSKHSLLDANATFKDPSNDAYRWATDAFTDEDHETADKEDTDGTNDPTIYDPIHDPVHKRGTWGGAATYYGSNTSWEDGVASGVEGHWSPGSLPGRSENRAVGHFNFSHFMAGTAGTQVKYTKDLEELPGDVAVYVKTTHSHNYNLPLSGVDLINATSLDAPSSVVNGTSWDKYEGRNFSGDNKAAEYKLGPDVSSKFGLENANVVGNTTKKGEAGFDVRPTYESWTINNHALFITAKFKTSVREETCSDACEGENCDEDRGGTVASDVTESGSDTNIDIGTTGNGHAIGSVVFASGGSTPTAATVRVDGVVFNIGSHVGYTENYGRASMALSSGEDLAIRQINLSNSMSYRGQINTGKIVVEMDHIDDHMDSGTLVASGTSLKFYNFTDMVLTSGWYEPIAGKTPYREVKIINPKLGVSPTAAYTVANADAISSILIAEYVDSVLANRILYEWDTETIPEVVTPVIPATHNLKTWTKGTNFEDLGGSDIKTTAMNKAGKQYQLKDVYRLDGGEHYLEKTTKVSDALYTAYTTSHYEKITHTRRYITTNIGGVNVAGYIGPYLLTQHIVNDKIANYEHNEDNKVKLFSNEKGYWEYYVYGTDGLHTKTISQASGELKPTLTATDLTPAQITTLSDDNIETAYYYYYDININGDTDGSSVAINDFVDVVVTKNKGTVVNCQFDIELGTESNTSLTFDGDSVEELLSFISKDPHAKLAGINVDFSTHASVKSYLVSAFDATSHKFKSETFGLENEVNRRWVYSDAPDNVKTSDSYAYLYGSTKASLSPDGQMTVNEQIDDKESKYTSGYANFDDLDPYNLYVPTFTNATLVHDKKTVLGTTEIDTSKTTLIVDRSGTSSQIVTDYSVVTEMLDSSGYRQITSNYYKGDTAVDMLNAGTADPNPTHQNFTQYSCCRIDYTTDKDGFKTKYIYTNDDLNLIARIDHYESNISTDILGSVAYSYDNLGRRIKTYQSKIYNAGTDFTDTAHWQVQSETSYATNGDILWQKDVLGKKTYTTDRMISITGGDPVVDQEQYTENRTYSNNTGSTGLVNVTWTNSLGQTVRQFVATAAWTAGTITPPSGSIDLNNTQQSRTTMTYDWAGRTVASRTFHTLPSTIANEGSAADYYESQNLYYDTHGRLILSKDHIGNYSAVVYGGVYDNGGTKYDTASSGKVIEQWSGTSIAEVDWNANWKAGTHNMTKISEMFYDTKRDHNVNDDSIPAGYTTRTTTLRSGDGLNYIGVNYKNFILADGSRLSWTLPDKGADNTQAPSSLQMTDDQGRSEASLSYNLNNALIGGVTVAWNTPLTTSTFTDVLLAKSESVYGDTTKPWRATGSTTHVIDYGTGSISTLTSTVEYDSRGRQEKTISPIGGNYTVIKYDDTKAGRVESQKQYVGGSGGTGGKLVAQSEPLYENTTYPTRVTGNRSYDRRPDLTGTEPTTLDTSNARRNTSYVWFDGFGRPIASASLGTAALPASYNPASPYTAGGISGAIVTETTYNLLGQSESTKANDGKVTKVFYDTLGRQKYVVENYDARTTGGDPFDPSDESGTGDTTDTSYDRVTKYTYSAYGQTEQIALDPNGDGTTTDQQVTTYKYAGMTGYNNGESGADDTTDGVVGLARYGHLVETIYPDTDASTTNDSVYQTHNPNGQLKTRKDQRGLELTYSYNDLGQRTEQKVTLGAIEKTDQQVKYAYDSLNRLIKLTTYKVIDSPSDITSEVQNVYDDFGQMTTQYQQIGGAVNTSTSLKVAYEHDAVANAYRLKNYTMPNGRKIHLGYGSGIDDSLSRPVSINEDDGSNGIGDPIVEYTRTGSGAVVAKAYPTPKVRLRHYEGAGAYPGIDSLGRNIQQRWGQYDPASSATADTSDVFNVTYGYDSASNKDYARRNVEAYKGYSQAYTQDGLNRLKTFHVGNNVSAIDNNISSSFRKQDREWELDALGNPTKIKDFGIEQQTANFNKANEFSDNGSTPGSAKKTQPNVGFVYEHFSLLTDKDKFTAVNSEIFTTTGGMFEFSALKTYDIGNQAMALFGQAEGLLTTRVTFSFPNNTTTGQAGFVFGYKSTQDYWLSVYDAADNKARIYHVHSVSGTITKELMYEAAKSVNTDGTMNLLNLLASKNAHLYGSPITIFSGGFPTGKIGLYTTNPGTKFDYMRLARHDNPGNNAGRWDNFSTGSNTNWFGSTKDKFMLGMDTFSSWQNGMFLRGFRSDNYRMTVAISRGDASYKYGTLGIFVNAKDKHNYEFIQVPHVGIDLDPALTYTPKPAMYRVVDGKTQAYMGNEVANATTHFNSNYPKDLAYADTLWVHVVRNGSDLKLYVIKSATKPDNDTAWTSSNLFFHTTVLEHDGGRVGVKAAGGYIFIDQLQVENLTDHDDNPSTADEYVTDYVDNFTINGDEQRPQGIEYDLAGNMIYDGTYKYTYDAWNRMTKIQRAYKIDRHAGTASLNMPGDLDANNPNTYNGLTGEVDLGTLQTGSTVGKFAYDGLSRRIQKKVTNSADQDFTYHYYYNGQQLIETRNASSMVLKQNVWGLTYIDELVQVAINQDPINAENTVDTSGQPVSSNENKCERFFWALTDANYNVMGLVSESGKLVERYEYTPYGGRQVYSHSWFLEDHDDDGVVIIGESLGGRQDRHDLNADGSVDGDDTTLHSAAGGQSFPVNDPDVLHATHGSARLSSSLAISLGSANFALNTIGHQGLMHDEEFEVGANATLIYNRARTLHPGLGRFMQNDPLGYVDGMSMYAYYAGMEGGLDPSGYVKWKHGKRMGNPRADVVMEKGDTLNDVAKFIKLEPSEFKLWLTNSNLNLQICTPTRCTKIRYLELDEKNICSDRTLSVPNIVLVTIGDVEIDEKQSVPINLAGLALSSEAYLFSKKSEKDGFMAILFKSTQTGDMSVLLAEPDIHGWFHSSHGASGALKFADTKEIGVFWEDLQPSLHHKLGFVTLFSCEAGMHASGSTLGQRKREGNGWLSMVSQFGEFRAFCTTFRPAFNSWDDVPIIDPPLPRNNIK